MLPRNYNFKDVHVDGARMIAEASRAAGVKRLVHFSALNADKEAPSRFLQSKVVPLASLLLFSQRISSVVKGKTQILFSL